MKKFQFGQKSGVIDASKVLEKREQFSISLRAQKKN